MKNHISLFIGAACAIRAASQLATAGADIWYLTGLFIGGSMIGIYLGKRA